MHHRNRAYGVYMLRAIDRSAQSINRHLGICCWHNALVPGAAAVNAYGVYTLAL